MTTRPVLAVMILSDSFYQTWSELAEELAVERVDLEPDGDVPDRCVAVLLAAGGEEDRAVDLLPSIRRPPDLPLYLVGARPSHRFAVEALRRGASDFFALPADLDVLRRTLERRAEVQRETHRVAQVAGDAGDAFAELLGESEAMRNAIAQARRVARHGDVTVLVQGETGTGKELLARALHYAGPRASGPFVAVNCAAIPSELIESELFGHEKGAFTDAHAVKPGLFEEAHGGTLFLDEIGHLPLPLQGKLLRALEDRRIRRVGATQSREVDVRIVAATHVDLEAAVQAGEFREDLYYRLNIVALTLPPLRERDADIERLAEAFLESLAARYGLPSAALDASVRRALRAHSWPGNVRELRHAMERALLLSEPGELDPQHLALGRATVKEGAAGAIPFPAPLNQILTSVAQSMVDQHDGNKSAAARALGISRARLQRLLERGEI